MPVWTRRLIAAVAAVVGLAATHAEVSASPTTGSGTTGSGQWVASWMAAPTDAMNGADASLVPILNIADQTFRVIVTPHKGGDRVRVRLTNVERPIPLQVGAASVAIAGAGAAVSPTVPLTFSDNRSVTIPAGGDVLSDPLNFDVKSWQRLAVSINVRGLAAFVTQHMNGNATSYYSTPGSGDHTASRTPNDFPLSTTVVPIVNRVDVHTATATPAVVTLGDSITDGFVSNDYLGVPQDRDVVDRNVRYPDFLQRRLDAAGINRSVVNAGISGNRVIADAFVPILGDAITSRLHRDVLEVPGVRDTILLGGINDLGIPIGANADQVIAGYKNIITRLKARGIRVHIGTILPASDALLNGYIAPLANPTRQVVNRWIRTQTMADSVFDFDKALRDPQNPNILAPKYSGPDRLHPNPAGYQKMADTVDLTRLG